MSHKTIFAKALCQDPNEVEHDGGMYEMLHSTHELLGNRFGELLASKDTSRPITRARKLILEYLTANSNDKLQVRNYDAHLDALKVVFKDDDELVRFANEAGESLNKDSPGSFCEEVVEFHRRKNKAQKNRTKRLEMMKKLDSERVGMVNLCRHKTFSAYETSETLIRSLLEGIDESSNNVKSVGGTEINHTSLYRRQQAKFGYALMNLGGKHITMVHDILKRYKQYKQLEMFEVRFIEHVYFESDERSLEALGVYNMIHTEFIFVIERYILGVGTKILELFGVSDKDSYFDMLQHSHQFQRLRERCAKNHWLFYKVKTMVNQLYFLSGCDKNILSFCDVLL